MSQGVKVVYLEGTSTLFIRLQTNLNDLSWRINEAHGLIREHIQGKGLEASGQLFTAYHNLDPRNCDVEIGISTSFPIEGSGSILRGSIPACEALEARYKGAYIPVVVTYNYLTGWMNENGYRKSGPHFEFYEGEYFDPTDGEMTTRILIPVLKQT